MKDERRGEKRENLSMKYAKSLTRLGTRGKPAVKHGMDGMGPGDAQTRGRVQARKEKGKSMFGTSIETGTSSVQ